MAWLLGPAAQGLEPWPRAHALGQRRPAPGLVPAPVMALALIPALVQATTPIIPVILRCAALGASACFWGTILNGCAVP